MAPWPLMIWLMLACSTNVLVQDPGWGVLMFQGPPRGGALIAKASLLDVMMQLPHSMHNLKPKCQSATL